MTSRLHCSSGRAETMKTTTDARPATDISDYESDFVRDHRSSGEDRNPSRTLFQRPAIKLLLLRCHNRIESAVR